MNRREWIIKSTLTAGSLLATNTLVSSMQENLSRKRLHLLLVSGWQTVNIGDIAHTPGLIHLLKTHFPDLKITLWPNDIDLQEEAALLSYFPDLTIIKDDFAQTGKAGNENIFLHMESADFMLHGSGPGIVGLEKLKIWRERTKKPFGIFGVTIGSIGDELKSLLDGAAFIFTRETHSLEILKAENVLNPVTGFGPDATFSLPYRKDSSAEFYMNLWDLKKGKFICVIPRLRYTPYHRIHVRIQWERQQIDRVIAENQKFAEEDHSKLREVIIRYVKETGNKVVLCPEMAYQTELYEPFLYNPLSSEIKDHILMHPYWQADDAASLYAQAAAVISAECHSPIIAMVNGTPAVYLRQPSDTIKGQMYYDLGLDDWIFEIEQTSGEQIAERVLEIVRHPEESREKVEKLNQRVKKIYDGNMGIMRKFLT